jgi:peptide deformylase
MILPIVAYGATVLRKVAGDINADYPQLDKFIEDMWETMYYSNGVGLAAPQVNKDIRVFVIDTEQIFENLDDDEQGKYPDAPGVKKVFINPHVQELEGEEWAYNEGCLSIPKIREDIMRPETIVLEYLDENFQPHTETFNGITARVIQHEYDHLEGKLFIDYLKPLKRKMLQGKLADISKGKVKVDYKMMYPK